MSVSLNALQGLAVEKEVQAAALEACRQILRDLKGSFKGDIDIDT